MKTQEIFKWLDWFLRIPCVTYNEEWLVGALQQRLGAIPALSVQTDNVGNLIIRYRPTNSGDKARFAIQAHLDHPGYVVTKKNGHIYEAKSYGKNLPECFEGEMLKFWVFGDRAKSGEALETGNGKLIFMSNENISIGAFGMWDFPPMVINGATIMGRGFDDTLMALFAAYLAMLYSQQGCPCPIDFYLTVAEEDGKVGSKILANDKRIAGQILNLEVTAERDTVVCGNGVVCRLADKETEFSKKMYELVHVLANQLRKRFSGLKVQFDFKHEDVGEPPVFHEHGVEVLTLAVPCKNKHNKAADGSPAPETICRDDLYSLFVMMLHVILCL